MQCEDCGEKLKKKTKKVKSSIVGLASILELIAVVFGGLALAYPPALPYKPILLPLAIILALVGHFLMYKKVKFMWCKSCKTESVINT
ncbi:hypothetical protein ACM9HF_04505 [Colwellia sp. RE-S-Sl-9]